MPVLSYTKQLAPLVRSGEKPHTIRFSRRGWKVGSMAYHATGTRTKNYHNFRTDPVTRVDDIMIRVVEFSYGTFKHEIKINGQPITADAQEALIKNDGFESTEAFFDFFRQRYGLGTHNGQLIQWAEKPIDYTAFPVS